METQNPPSSLWFSKRYSSISLNSSGYFDYLCNNAEETLKNLPNCNLITYRGMSVTKGVWGERIKAGDVVSDRGFISTSASIHAANKFTNAKEESVLFRVAGREGKYISRYSFFRADRGGGESEILFSPGSKFEVLAIAKKKGTKKIYVLLGQSFLWGKYKDKNQGQKIKWDGIVKNMYDGASI